MSRPTVSLFILAGGKGERFWPLSRAQHPKQFLKLDRSGKSLIQTTYERLKKMIDVMRLSGVNGSIRIITTQEQMSRILEHLPYVPQEHILSEPVGRDTAPAVAWATLWAMGESENQILAFFPADHYIDGLDAFFSDVSEAVHLAARKEALVILGIQPSFPATGYGYIEVGEPLNEPQFQDMGGRTAAFFRVRRFVEKPSRDKAVSFLESGRYLWNSGILIGRADVLYRELEHFVPDIVRPLKEQGPGAYGTLPRISVDFAVLERSEAVVVRPSSFVWDDLGDWTALERHLKDEAGNVVLARHVGLDTEGSILYTTGTDLIVTIGIQDVVIVRDGDVTLVCHKDRVPQIKQVLARLRENRALEQYL